MRNILHAKFGDQLAKQSRTSDKVPRISPDRQLPSKPVEELEAALTSTRCVACKQRTNPDGHLQSPDREASIETHGSA
jgi:hypothetical protein